MADCFQNIIGISQSSCACFSDDFNEDAAKSNSGLYMDQLPESPSLEAVKAVRECGATLQDVLEQARTNGILEFKKELYMELGTRYTVKQQAYEGAVGQATSIGYLNLSYPYAGVALEMTGIRGATVRISGIQPLFNYDGTLQVTVYKAIMAGGAYQILEQVATITVDTLIANPVSQAPSSELILDTTDGNGRALSYLFTYARESAQPRDNTTSCGCGNKETILHQYLRPKGIQSADGSEWLLSQRTERLNGLLISVEARCGTGAFMCENYNRDEFIRQAMNYAVLYRSVANAITGILNSQLISRYSQAGREQMAFNVNVLRGKFRKSVAWLAEQMDLTQNDCYKCLPGGIGGSPYEYMKDGILM